MSGEPSRESWSGTEVTVTGGAGFLGRSTVKALGEVGADVRTIRSAEHDLRDAEQCSQALEGSEVVIHLAANVGGIGYNRRNPGPLARDNLLMAANVFESCRELGVRKLVAACSVCAYPAETPVPFREDDIWNGYPEASNAPYGIAKRNLIVLSDAYRRQFDLDSCVPVIVNLYGPGDNFDLESSHVIPALVRKMIEAQERGEGEVVLWGDGSPTREFLYVEDCAEGIFLASQRYDGAEPVNLGTGEEISIRELAELVAELTGFEGELVWDTSKPNGQPRRQLDVSRAEQLFGFQARTALRTGIERTVGWYRAEAPSYAAG